MLCVRSLKNDKAYGQVQMEQNQASQYIEQAGSIVIGPVLPSHPHVWLAVALCNLCNTPEGS